MYFLKKALIFLATLGLSVSAFSSNDGIDYSRDKDSKQVFATAPGGNKCTVTAGIKAIHVVNPSSKIALIMIKESDKSILLQEGTPNLKQNCQGADFKGRRTTLDQKAKGNVFLVPKKVRSSSMDGGMIAMVETESGDLLVIKNDGSVAKSETELNIIPNFDSLEKNETCYGDSNVEFSSKPYIAVSKDGTVYAISKSGNITEQGRYTGVSPINDFKTERKFCQDTRPPAPAPRPTPNTTSEDY